MIERNTQHPPRRRSRHAHGARRIGLALALVLAGLLPAERAAAIPTTDWRDYTVISLDRMVIGPNLNLTGNYATVNPGGTIEIGLNTFQLDDSPPPFMAADTLDLGPQASIVDAYTNAIVGNSSAEVRGQIFPQSFPLPILLPTLPVADVCHACTLGGPDVMVPVGDTVTLSPGCYGQLLARQTSTVFLNSGVYRFRDWDIRKFASVTANGPVTIYIRENLAAQEGNFVGPASGNPDHFAAWVGSRVTCDPGTVPTNTDIGNAAVYIGTLFVPNDPNMHFRKDAILLGTAVGGEVHIRGTHEGRPPTPTPTPSPTMVPTPTPTPTPKQTPTPTPKQTPTPTPVQTPTPTPKQTPTPTPVQTPTPTPKQTPTPTPVQTPTPTPVLTPTPTPVQTPTPTPVQTPTPTPTNRPSPTPTQPFNPPTPTPKQTPTPTPKGTPTPTPLNTPTPTPKGTPTPTPQGTPTPTVKPSPTPTQPFNPPTPTMGPRKKPWGKKSGIINPVLPPRNGPGVAPSMRRPMGSALR